VRIVLGLLVFVVLLFVFVFPTRTYLGQRNETKVVEERLELLREENRRLADETDRLMTDEEIERIAREEYNLVRPGETPYAVVPEDSAAEGAP
jgi:cell division protein FtsB